MSFTHEWSPHKVQIYSNARQFEDKMTQHSNISDIQRHNETYADYGDNVMIGIG